MRQINCLFALAELTHMTVNQLGVTLALLSLAAVLANKSRGMYFRICPFLFFNALGQYS